MTDEKFLQQWIEGSSEYRVTILTSPHIVFPALDQVTLRKYSRRLGTDEWLPENQSVTVFKAKLLEALT